MLSLLFRFLPPRTFINKIIIMPVWPAVERELVQWQIVYWKKHTWIGYSPSWFQYNLYKTYKNAVRMNWWKEDGIIKLKLIEIWDES